MNQDLNYKQGYYYLFNQYAELIKAIQRIQQTAEEIIISDPSAIQMSPIPEAIIQGMAGKITDENRKEVTQEK